MKNISLIMILLFGTILWAQKPEGLTDRPEEAARDSYIFVFDNSVKTGDVPGLAKGMVRAGGGNLTHTYGAALKGFTAKMPEHAARNMVMRNPRIAYYVRNGTAYGMGSMQGQAKPGSDPDPQSVPYGITRVGGGSNAASGTAWVIDSGVDLDHPDLNVDVARSVSFISYGGPSNQSPDDYNGHGSHVAGTIAALDNNIQVIGVAPGTTVVSIRVLGRNNSGTWADIIAGLDHVAANAAPGDVANFSIGGGPNQAVDDAVVGVAAVIPITISAGNDGNDSNTASPARVNGPNIYTVSAIDINDDLASWSNWGIPPVDWAEPGVSVFSTYKNGGTATYNGTSMAAPHLAGLLLLGGVQNGGYSGNTDPNGDNHPIGVQ